jgi:hypothetical protein
MELSKSFERELLSADEVEALRREIEKFGRLPEDHGFVWVYGTTMGGFVETAPQMPRTREDQDKALNKTEAPRRLEFSVGLQGPRLEVTERFGKCELKVSGLREDAAEELLHAAERVVNTSEPPNS